MLTDHLPAWMADYVTETANELQVSTDAVALLSLGALSAAVNGGANVQPVNDWKEPVALYTLALLASGEGKSPVFGRLLDPVEKAYETATGISGASDPKYQTIRNRVNQRVLKATETKLLRQVLAGSLTAEEMTAELNMVERGFSQFGNSMNVPLRVLTDVTPAALIDALASNEGRVVLATPEAEGLMNFRGGSMEGLLKSHGGEKLTQSRRGMGEVTIKRPVMTMMLAMQPSVLGKLGSDMVNRGVMPRFLISYPESKMGQRQSLTVLTTDETADEYYDHMVGIVEKYSAREVRTIGFENLARREIGSWREEIEPMLAPGAELGAIDAWGSKVRGGHFIRLAALLAIANDREMVTIADCTAAKAILRALIVDARRAFGDMGASFASDDTVHLMGIVSSKLNGEPFTKRDIVRRSNRFTDFPDRCSDALDRAVEHGLLTEGRRGKVVTYQEVR